MKSEYVKHMEFNRLLGFNTPKAKTEGKTIRAGCFIPGNALDEFNYILGALSPENLCCDGEASPAYVRQRSKALNTDWANLEKRLGFKVSHDDIYKLWSTR